MSTSIIPMMIQQNEEIIDIIKSKKKDSTKEITYSNSMKNVYLADESEYKGVKYFIIAGGIHPCAYVMCDEEFVNNHKNEWGDLDFISVHGGVTWLEDADHLKHHPDDCTGIYFGWDYGHAGDWAGYYQDVENMVYENHKYTLMEIQNHCKDAIDQYLKIIRKERRGDNYNKSEK